MSYFVPTQVDSKPAGQPEQASPNHAVSTNGPKLVFCACPADFGDKVSLYCNGYKSPDWSLSPQDLVLMPDLWLLAWVQLFTIAHIVIGLSLHIHFFLHPRCGELREYAKNEILNLLLTPKNYFSCVPQYLVIDMLSD